MKTDIAISCNIHRMLRTAALSSVPWVLAVQLRYEYISCGFFEWLYISSTKITISIIPLFKCFLVIVLDTLLIMLVLSSCLERRNSSRAINWRAGAVVFAIIVFSYIHKYGLPVMKIPKIPAGFEGVGWQKMEFNIAWYGWE